MGLLDGQIASLFGSVFGQFYLDGTLIRQTQINDGQGGGSVLSLSQPCKVQVDACTEAMRAQAGYTDKDVRILILQAFISGGDVDTDCMVTASGTTYQIASVMEDPASSYWECRGTKL